MFKDLLTILLCLFLSPCFSQTPLYDAVVAAKNSVSFSETNLFSAKESIAQNAKLKSNLADGLTLELNENALKDLISESPAALQMSIDRGATQKPLKLELVEQTLFAYDFRVLTDAAPNGVAVNQGIHYRGIVAGEMNSVVAISVFENNIMGVIESTTSGQMVIGQNQANKNEYLLYKTADVLAQPNMDCATADIPLTKEQIDNMLSHDHTAGKVDKCVNVYFEADYALFSERGGVNETVAYITGLFNMAATLYQNEGITMKVSEMFVWTSADYYNYPQLRDALNQFKRVRTDFDGDLGMLISGSDLIPGGISFVNGLGTDFNYSMCRLAVSESDLPSFNLTANMIAHELGHNLGSPHTHACAWNGNNTPIDGCGAAAGYSQGCDGVIPTVGGTIMSYCQLLSDVGVNWANGFGEQPGNLLRSIIASADCLGACEVPQCHSISFEKKDVTCHGAKDGIIAISIENGTAPFEIEWSNGSNATAINNLPFGKYTVEVTDANGCFVIETIEITQPERMTFDLYWANVSEAGETDGFIDLTVKGGKADYQYNWSNGMTTEDLDDLAAGMYEVTVTDKNNCQKSALVPVNEPNEKKATLTVDETEVEEVTTSTDVAVDFPKGKKEIEVFPNPFVNQFSVQFESELAEQVKVAVLDISGKEIKCEIQNTTTGQNTFEINGSNLNEGIYIIQISGSATQQTQKIIKTK